MDPEEERVLYLTRVGRDKIFKYGTYTMTKAREITQDHPFYAKSAEDPGPGSADEEFVQEAQMPPGDMEPVMSAEAEPNPEAFASQIISSNFKVGLTQEEVDALLNGMN